MSSPITLHITLLQPPAGIDFGVQEGKGNGYLTVQKQRSDGSDLQFKTTVEPRQAKDGQMDFTGRAVQGPLGGRFLYIGIGASAGQDGTPINRRLKIPLYTIDGATLEGAKAAGALYTRIQGTAKDGTPTCATVKPFDGWKLRKT